MMRLQIMLTFFLLTNINVFAQTDTIDYISCGGSIPAGWSVHDSTGNDFFWRHTNSGIEAVWNPAFLTEMNSTSNADGWLLFHSAYYNTDTTGGVLNEANPIVLMNSTLTSTPFSFSSESTVILSFEHWYHTLSSPTWGSLDLKVSNDSINWTTYVLNTGSDSPLTGGQNQVENVILDISAIAANEGQVWFQFHVNNLAWHFWMVDDLLFARNFSLASTDDDAADLFEVNIGPNPIECKLNISTRFFEKVSYTLHDMKGKRIMWGRLNGKQTSIQIEQLLPGNYTLTLNDETNRLRTIQLIKTQ